MSLLNLGNVLEMTQRLAADLGDRRAIDKLSTRAA
jgi:hypothetical protein